MSGPAPEEVALIVLTGGASRRMRVDKAAMDSGWGVPLAGRAVAALAGVASAGVILAGREVPGVEGTVVADEAPGLGPLAGLAPALRACAAPYALVVACDMPSIDPALARLILGDLVRGSQAHATWGRATTPVDAAVCAGAVGRGIEPLPLAVRSAAGPRLLAALSTGSRSLREGLEHLRVVVVGEARWREVDPAGASFENWNEPGDVRPLAPI